MSFHERRFPGETSEYLSRRDELLRAEVELRNRIEELAAERRRLPEGGAVPEDYRFEKAPGENVRLSELFEPGRSSLVLYRYMYGPRMEEPCPICTSIIDGLEATAPHAKDA